MSQTAVHDLLNQYQRTFQIIYEDIKRFDESQWIKGLDFFLTPVNIAMHIFDCLDFYFSDVSIVAYVWGHYFGGGWWELPVEKLPTKENVLVYAHQIETRVAAEIGALTDADLPLPFLADDSVETYLGHYIYALRHTVHHHGELAALSVYHGNAGGSWA